MLIRSGQMTLRPVRSAAPGLTGKVAEPPAPGDEIAIEVGGPVTAWPTEGSV